jgi:hypothetical protein
MIYTAINNPERCHSHSDLGPAPELLDQLQHCICENPYGVRTERVYVYWARWYIRFHGLRHPMDMGDQRFTLSCHTWSTSGRSPAPPICKRNMHCSFCKKILQIESQWIEGIKPLLLNQRVIHAIYVRLAGIDAPERAQPFGQVSRRHLSDLVYGRDVTLNCGKRDRYKRKVCVVALDGKNISFAQLEAGVACWYQPNIRLVFKMALLDAYVRDENGTKRTLCWQSMSVRADKWISSEHCVDMQTEGAGTYTMHAAYQHRTR